jgi:hypothetical protein
VNTLHKGDADDDDDIGSNIVRITTVLTTLLKFN